MNNKKIILGSSSITILKEVEWNLTDTDYEIMPANDLDDFYELLKSQNPDLLIIDRDMQDGQGISLCKEIKSSEQYAQFPVIMLVKKTEEENGESINALKKECKPDRLLTVPLESSKLLSTVQYYFAKQSPVSDLFIQDLTSPDAGEAIPLSEADMPEEPEGILSIPEEPEGISGITEELAGITEEPEGISEELSPFEGQGFRGEPAGEEKGLGEATPVNEAGILEEPEGISGITEELGSISGMPEESEGISGITEELAGITEEPEGISEEPSPFEGQGFRGEPAGEEKGLGEAIPVSEAGIPQEPEGTSGMPEEPEGISGITEELGSISGMPEEPEGISGITEELAGITEEPEGISEEPSPFEGQGFRGEPAGEEKGLGEAIPVSEAGIPQEPEGTSGMPEEPEGISGITEELGSISGMPEEPEGISGITEELAGITEEPEGISEEPSPFEGQGFRGEPAGQEKGLGEATPVNEAGILQEPEGTSGMPEEPEGISGITEELGSISGMPEEPEGISGITEELAGITEELEGISEEPSPFEGQGFRGEPAGEEKGLGEATPVSEAGIPEELHHDEMPSLSAEDALAETIKVVEDAVRRSKSVHDKVVSEKPLQEEPSQDEIGQEKSAQGETFQEPVQEELSHAIDFTHVEPVSEKNIQDSEELETKQTGIFREQMNKVIEESVPEMTKKIVQEQIAKIVDEKTLVKMIVDEFDQNREFVSKLLADVAPDIINKAVERMVPELAEKIIRDEIEHIKQGCG